MHTIKKAKNTTTKVNENMKRYCTIPASLPSLVVCSSKSEGAGSSSSLSVSEFTLSSMSESRGSLPKALDVNKSR